MTFGPLETRGRLPLVLSLAGSISLAGCATTESGTHNVFDDVRLMWGSDEALSLEQRALRDGARQHASTRIWGAVTGGLIGGLGGALAASALDVDPVTGLVIGATAGTMIGYAGGAYVASKNEAAADQQAALRNQIAGADLDAERYAAMAANARVVVARHEQDIARLNADFAANRMSVDTYRKEISALRGDAAAIKALLIESEGNIALMERDIQSRQAAGQSTAELAAAKARLAAESAELRHSWVQLVEAIGTIPPAVGAPVVS